jgi:hypothetical protein
VETEGFFYLQDLGGNLFLIEFEKANNKARILEGHPQAFEGSLFLVEGFDGRTSPSEYTFDRASFWVQMTNLPGRTKFRYLQLYEPQLI